MGVAKFIWNFAKGILAFIFAGLGIMTNVTPQQAQSNLSAWFSNPPGWMLPPQIDAYGEIFFFTLALLLCLSVIGPWLFKKNVGVQIVNDLDGRFQRMADTLYPKKSRFEIWFGRLFPPTMIATDDPVVIRDGVSEKILGGGNDFRKMFESISPIHPDWPIRNLFFYLSPALKNGQTDDTCEQTGLEIGDKLATGQLKSWGRIDRNDGTRAIQTEIDKDYWKYAEFTYLFLGTDPNERYLVHTVPRDGCKFMGIAQYRDIQVSKTQALTVWPVSVDEQAEADLNLGFYKETFRIKPTEDNALLRLAQLRTEGVVIRNNASQILFTSGLDAWVSNVNRWMKEVIEAIKPISAAESEWFATLGEVPAARVAIPNVRLGGDADREAYIATFCQHDYRLARLDALLKKNGIGA